jgi:hypothetical protein
MIDPARAHQDERALGEGRIDQKRRARERQSKIDVVQEQEWRKYRPCSIDSCKGPLDSPCVETDNEPFSTNLSHSMIASGDHAAN